jgi:hypothetical protein
MTRANEALTSGSIRGIFGCMLHVEIADPPCRRSIEQEQSNRVGSSRSQIKNIYLSFFRKSCFLFRHPDSVRGADASSRTRDGMRWTRRCRTTSGILSRTAKPCGPGAPMQVPSFSNLPRGDGDNKARSHRGERGISRKPSRRECRRKRLTCGDLLVCFFHSHTRLRVRLAPGIPCALLSFEGNVRHNSDAIAPRECGSVPAV